MTTTLQSVVASGDVSSVRALLRANRSLLSSSPSKPVTKQQQQQQQRRMEDLNPLHVAIRNGREDVVELLMSEFGADADSRAPDGSTCLWLACQARSVGLVRRFGWQADVAIMDDPLGTMHHRTTVFASCVLRDWHEEALTLLRFHSDAVHFEGVSLLLTAIDNRRLDLLCAMLARMRSPLSPDVEVTRLLLAAIEHASTDVLEMVLALPEANEVPDAHRRTALRHAIKVGDPTIVDALLDCGFCKPDFETEQPGGMPGLYGSDSDSPLSLALEQQRQDIVDLLITKYDVVVAKHTKRALDRVAPKAVHELENNPTLIVPRFKKLQGSHKITSRDYCQLALHYWRHGMRPAFETLMLRRVEHGWHESLVVSAAACGHATLVERLIRQVNVAHYAATLLPRTAAKSGQWHVARMFVHRIVGIASCSKWMAKAMQVHMPDVVDLLALIGGAEAINTPISHGGLTPLEYSLKLSMEDIAVSLIVNHGADVRSLHVLHLAVECGLTKALAAILNNGGRSNVNKQNEHGQTALILACYHGQVAAALSLIRDFLADTKVADNQGHTALHVAASEGLPDVVEAIMQNGGRSILNHKNKSGASALLHACASGQAEVAISFVNYYLADCNLADSIGWTPLHFAAWHGWWDVVEAILAHGGRSSLTVKTCDGATPVQLARERRHPHAVRILKQAAEGVEH
eukprot:TRINITY_DN60450_c1_g1_i1.p1 TRINITY_DN60450_c1_g1~~TRINITY_DN60450_c1_g1_i1.p1  ORF type:complete len:690 (+),score=277.28 TRINITY_DN60450_c1_g1_i1:33-2102(+)